MNLRVFQKVPDARKPKTPDQSVLPFEFILNSTVLKRTVGLLGHHGLEVYAAGGKARHEPSLRQCCALFRSRMRRKEEADEADGAFSNTLY